MRRKADSQLDVVGVEGVEKKKLTFANSPVRWKNGAEVALRTLTNSSSSSGRTQRFSPCFATPPSSNSHTGGNSYRISTSTASTYLVCFPEARLAASTDAYQKGKKRNRI